MTRSAPPPGWLTCRYGQAPPLQIFFKIAQVTRMLLAPLFFFDTFDSFFKYSTQIDFEYLEKLLNAFTAFSLFSKTCVFKKKKAEKFRKSSQFDKAWYLCRGPPRKSEPVFNHIQVFGGNEMNKIKLHKICAKNIFIVALALPRYRVSSSSVSGRKGVNT